MIDKLLAELSKATVWMPTQVLVDKVGARNTTNVSLRLKDLEKNGSAVSRSRMEFGIKVIEWRHADKKDVGDFVPGGRGTKAAPVVKKSLTTEMPTAEESSVVEMPTDKACCNDAAVVATTAGSHVSALRKEIAELTDELAVFGKQNSVLTTELNGVCRDRDSKRDTIQSMSSAAIKFCGITAELTGGDKYPLNLYECELLIADHVTYMERKITELEKTVAQQHKEIEAKDAELSIAHSANGGWLALAKEFECKNIPEIRVFINSSLARIEALKTAKAAEPNKPGQPRRPFSVTGLTGYHTGNDRVTLFLNRRLSARSVTFPADKLAQLADMAKEAS